MENTASSQPQQTEKSNESAKLYTGWHVAKVYDPQEKWGKTYQEVLVAKQVNGEDKDRMMMLRVSEKFIDSVKDLKHNNLLAFTAYQININSKVEGHEKVQKSFLKAVMPVVVLAEKREHKITGRLVADPVLKPVRDGNIARFVIAINRKDKDPIYHNVNASPKFTEGLENFKKGELVTIKGYHTIKPEVKDGKKRELELIQLSSKVAKYEKEQELDQDATQDQSTEQQETKTKPATKTKESSKPAVSPEEKKTKNQKGKKLGR